ncbi:MAG: hypothetical protein ABFD12_00420 [Syntrophorhabdus sp.]
MMDFENWIKTLPEELDGPSIGFARMVWQAAQQAEMERERGKVLAEGWDDRYAKAITALVEERERARALVDALKEAIDSGMVPISSASEGGANKYSRQVFAADRIRAAIAKYEGEK